MNIAIEDRQTDQHYRYRMDLLETKYETEKTVIVNLESVAKSLNVVPKMILKYFGIRLGCQTIQPNILKGYHRNLQDILQRFIEEYVLCLKCQLPELDYRRGKKEIRFSCRSCGFTRKIDKTDRLFTSI